MPSLSKNLRAEKVSAKAIKSLKGKLNHKNLVGVWCSCNKKTRGIVKVVVKSSGNALKIRVYGACTPSPCDWGAVSGIAYASSVTSKTAIAFSAKYKFGFKDAIVTGHLDNGTLILETYNKFKDGSGRSAYYSREYLCKCKD